MKTPHVTPPWPIRRPDNGSRDHQETPVIQMLIIAGADVGGREVFIHYEDSGSPDRICTVSRDPLSTNQRAQSSDHVTHPAPTCCTPDVISLSWGRYNSLLPLSDAVSCSYQHLTIVSSHPPRPSLPPMTPDLALFQTGLSTLCPSIHSQILCPALS